MPSRAAAAQSASGRDSSITQLSSSQLSSRESVTSNMGRRCAHDGCNRLSLTGGPKCHSHTTKPQSSPPIRGSAQIRGTDLLSPANSQMNNESTSPGRPDAMSPVAAGNGPSRRTGESQNPPHPAKGLSHKSLPAKATARKSVPKPGQRREDSNSAAADEAEIVVASKPTTSTNKIKASKRAHDNVLDSPRKKQRLGLSNAAAEFEELRPLINGATHNVPAKRPDLPTSRPTPQPATITTTAAVSLASLTAALTDKTDEQSRLESRGTEASPPKTHVSLDASLHWKSREVKAKKKMLRATSVAEHASEKLRAGPTTASSFHPRERTAEREKSNTEAPTQEHSFKMSGQGMTSSSTVEPNKVRDITQTVSRASSFSGKEPPPIPRDVAFSARNQIASNQPIQSQERRPSAKNNHGPQPPAAPRQPVSSEQSMRTTEILSHIPEETKIGMKAPVAVREDSRGSQGHQPSLTSSQRKDAASKLQSGYSEHSGALPQRPKGQGLIQQEAVTPPKNNRTAYQAADFPEKAKWPSTNGVAATAKSDTTGTQLRKEGNSVKTGQPPQNLPPVINLVSSDSDSPAPPRTKPKTIFKTKPPITEPQEARPGLQMPSVAIGPIPTLTGVPPKPDPSTNGLTESWQMGGKPWTIGVPSPTSFEDKAHVRQRPSASSEPVASGSGDKITDSDKPLLSPSHRGTNVTPKQWKALPLSQRKQVLQDQHDERRFDEFIYGPANASNHPRPSPRDKASVEAFTMPKKTPPHYFRHFDPRVHWTHSRPKEWYERKQKEIADRGNRKAPRNFGQAAARRAKQKASARPRKVDLPERVEKNPKWVAALAELDDMAKSYHEAQRAKARLRKKRQKAAKDQEGDTVMQDAPLETSESTKEAPIIGGMRRPLLEVMMNRRWR